MLGYLVEIYLSDIVDFLDILGDPSFTCLSLFNLYPTNEK